jgi:broad specificity phosphatase PhoE
MKRTPRLSMAATVAAAWLSLVACNAPYTAAYVVRHAEKAAPTGDEEPAGDVPLTAEGERRAQALATLLSDQNVEAVFSTSWKRTRQTACPLAEQLGLEIETYSDVEDVAERVASEFKNKTVLIVGHSNTVPSIIEALGGEVPRDFAAGIPAEQYDNLFLVLSNSSGTGVLPVRFGVPPSTPDGGCEP